MADHSTIADCRKRWEAYRVEDYSMVQSRICFCLDGGRRFLVTVRGGYIVGVIDPADGESLPQDRWSGFKTIMGLFSLIESIDTTEVASLQVSYDTRYGYPRRVFVDPGAAMADEEFGYETSLVN